MDGPLRMAYISVLCGITFQPGENEHKPYAALILDGPDLYAAVEALHESTGTSAFIQYVKSQVLVRILTS